MKYRLLFFILVFFVSAIMSVAGNKYDSKVIMCVDTVEVEIDTTYADSPYCSFKVEYWNGGKGKLVIDSVLTSCHCTVVKYDKVALQHGKRSCLNVDVDMSGFGMGRYFGDIFVYYNGRNEPFELHFTGLLVRREDAL